MIIYIGCRKTTFDDNIVSNYTYQEFYDLCYSMPTFQQLPEKERKLKIKEAYGNLNSNAKESRKPSKKRTRPNLHSDNAKQLGRDSRAEQIADDGRKDVRRKEDKTEIQQQGLRSEKKKVKQ